MGCSYVEPEAGNSLLSAAQRLQAAISGQGLPVSQVPRWDPSQPGGGAADGGRVGEMHEGDLPSLEDGYGPEGASVHEGTVIFGDRRGGHMSHNVGGGEGEKPV